MKKLEPLDLDGIKTYSLSERHSKVSFRDFGRPWEKGGGFKEFVARLPRILAGTALREVAAAWVQARKHGRQVLLGMGAHPIKVGLSPILIDLLKRGLITGVAMNGAGIIHDAEVAMAGCTSEDVEQELGCGRFGMARETAEFLNAAISWGARQGLGLGEAVGRRLLGADFPHQDLSLVAAAAEPGGAVDGARGGGHRHHPPAPVGGPGGPGRRPPTWIFASLPPWSAAGRRGLHQPGLHGDHPGGLFEGPHPGPQPGP